MSILSFVNKTCQKQMEFFFIGIFTIFSLVKLIYHLVYQLKSQLMSKLQSGDLCKVPNNIVFTFFQDQEIHSTIIIQNLLDRIVSYKIKTNKPGIYLVKPMDGQIFNKSSVTIAFKRKQLTLQNFNMVQNNPGQAKQKFLIEFTCEIEDAVGILHKHQQIAYLGVTFTKTTKDEKIKWNDQSKTRKDKVVDKKSELEKLLVKKNEQLRSLIMERQTLQAKRAGSSQKSIFKQLDLINVIVVALLIGFVMF